jgi:site-specific DNA-methyltransferase (adenine-specific)
MPDQSIDSVVTDPPYGLSFMDKKWDYDVPSVEIWQQVLRVMKPGGHLLSFSGTRTYHRMVVAIEDAGFEIRDQIGWLYGSGFPKSHNLDGNWDGWGTALKPAWEPIVMARKPFTGTVAANVLKHGTGGLNIAACRVAGDESTKRSANIIGVQQCGGANHRPQHDSDPQPRVNGSDLGRWPANVIPDGSDEVMEAFAAHGEKTSGGDRRSPKTAGIYGAFAGMEAPREFAANKGTASRFFYCAKASKTDRCGSKHPTVKPVALMRYLCRLVTPPGGTVLDPFAGSGTTGQAAVEEGFDVVLIEREAEYCADIRHRLALPILAPDPATPSPQNQPDTSPDASPGSC